MSDQNNTKELTAKENEKKKPPIPRNVSGVAYIDKNGGLKYCTTGPGRELPNDFKEWHRHHITQK